MPDFSQRSSVEETVDAVAKLLDEHASNPSSASGTRGVDEVRYSFDAGLILQIAYTIVSGVIIDILKDEYLKHGRAKLHNEISRLQEELTRAEKNRDAMVRLINDSISLMKSLRPTTPPVHVDSAKISRILEDNGWAPQEAETESAKVAALLEDK